MLVYSNSFTASWHYDDFHHIRDNSKIRKISNIPSYFIDPGAFSHYPSSRMYRPLLMASHAVNYSLSLHFYEDGTNIVLYHVTNFLFHVMTTILLFFTALHLMGEVKARGTPIILAAAFGSLVFGLHPVNSETVVYISSRSSSMATLFTLASFYSYLHIEKNKYWSFPTLLSLLFFASGLLSKEIAIVLPLLILVYDRTSYHIKRSDSLATPKTDWVQQSFLYFPYLLIASAYMFIRYIFLNENLLNSLVSQTFHPDIHNTSSHLATQLRVWVFYIKEWFFPFNLSIDHSFSVSNSFFEPTAILAAMGIATVITITLYLSPKYSLIKLGIFWFFISLLPTSIFKLFIILNDHRLYLPGIGAAIVISFGATSLLKRAKWKNHYTNQIITAVGLSILVLFGITTHLNNDVYATEKTLWTHVIEKNPDSYRANLNLGLAAWREWQLTRSLELLEKARDLGPQYPFAYVSLAAVYHDLGRDDFALTQLRTAQSLSPEDVNVLGNLGRLLKIMGKQSEALAVYRQLIYLDPGHLEALNDLSEIYLIKGNLNEALQHIETLLSLEPFSTKALLKLATVHKTAGREKAAIDALRRFIAIADNTDPNLKKAHMMLESLLPK